MGYWYPSGLAKTFCKWDIYVPLVMKGLTFNDETVSDLKTLSVPRSKHSASVIKTVNAVYCYCRGVLRDLHKT
jgi:hypothetical protein